MIKGNCYTWNQIIKFSIEGEYNNSELGSYTVGKNFIVLESDLHTLSFVLTGTQGQESIYECIYID